MKLLLILLPLSVFSQTKLEVKAYIKALNVEHEDIIYRQVLKETGHLKCTNCSLDNNNLFGFRWNHKYLEFDTWQESIHYYLKWRIRKGYHGQDYYQFLTDKWGAPNMDRYINTLKQIRI